MPRLTCNFQGRLGNCMFEAAAVIATARRHGLAPCFPAEECDYYQGIPAFQRYLKPILQKFDKCTDHGSFAVHEDWIHGYRELPKFERDTMLRGFYTCSRYFNDYRKDIIALFSPDKAEIDRRVADLRRGFPGRRLVAVHVRRTDYVTDYQWDLPVEYYQKAAERFPGAVFIVFSDDIEWCKRALTFMPERVYMQALDYIEMQLMGNIGDAIIIANSTFSTWGSVLGDPDANKTVIAPMEWCRKGNWNRDIQEPHWTLL